MKNTFINDTSLVNYPFAEDKPLPFPRHAVLGMSVSLYMPGAFQLRTLNVSAVEIGNGRITLAVTLNEDTLLGMVTAESRSYGKLSTETDDYKANMILAAGSLDGIPPMSRKCWLDLEPSCVNAFYSTYDRGYLVGVKDMFVNGAAYECGERIGLSFAGDIRVTGDDTDHGYSPLDYWDDTTYVDIEGFASIGDGTTVQAGLVGYPKVTSINGVSVPASDDFGTALYLHVAPMPSEDPDTDVGAHRLSFGVTNMLSPDDMRLPGDPLGGPWKPDEGFNDDVGSGSVLTIIGGSDIPTCFDTGDESDQPDSDNAMPSTIQEA